MDVSPSLDTEQEVALIFWKDNLDFSSHFTPGHLDCNPQRGLSAGT